MKKLFYLLLCMPLAFAACEPEPEPQPEPQPEVKDPVLTLTSEATLNFAAEGGEGVITYTLENAVEGTNLEATCEAEWVTNVAAGENVTFTVVANETEEARETKVVVAYGEASFEVAVKQDGKESEPGPEPNPEPGVEFVAEVLTGEYYATTYSETYNYYISLSNIGFSPDGYPYAGGIYYTLDLYGVEPVIDSEGYLTIPAGTYNFDAYDTAAEWSIGNEYSGYYVVNADGTDYEIKTNLESGTAVVTEDGITLTAVINGENHTVTYNGAPTFFVGKPVEGGEFEANYLQGYYYGTQYSATYNFEVILSDIGISDGYFQAGGTYYVLDLYTNEEPTLDGESYVTIPAGTYEFDAGDSAAAWTMGNYYSGFNVVNAAGNGYDAQAYFDDATVVVTENDITVNAVISGVEHVVVYNDVPKFLVEATRAANAKVAKLNMTKGMNLK